jgi:L-rhamnose mutarotase
MLKKICLVISLSFFLLFSQNLNFEYISRQLKDLATRDVTSGSQASKWWKEYQEVVISYNKAINWRGTMQGMEYRDEATKWAGKARKRQGDIKDMILVHLTKSLDPYTRTCLRIAGKQFTKPERLVFKVAAVGITLASGGALGSTVIKSFAPDIAHEVARTLEEEEIIDNKSKKTADIMIDAGSLAWNVKNIMNAPDKKALIAEASKLGLRVTNCIVVGNKCNLTLKKGGRSQKVSIEFESSESKEDFDFRITYPTNNQKNWNKKVKGKCSAEYKGYKVKVYIKTDKEYLQGEAIVNKYGKWSINKTWPTKGTKNTIFAELYNKKGKKVATSNKVILYP